MKSFHQFTLLIESVRETATIAVFRQNKNGLEILIGKKDTGEWVLPGGHVEKNESPIQAALRELEEETGVSLRHLSKVMKYKEKNWIDYVYSALIKSNQELEADDDIKKVKWINIKNLPELSSPHQKYVHKALQKIQ